MTQDGNLTPASVDPIDHNSRVVRFGKRVTPAVAGLVHRMGAARQIDRLAMYLHFVGGQGSGTGWDIGEFVVAARHLAGVERPVVVDCGANAGDWTRHVRRRLGSDRGRWLLVEPATSYVDRLKAMPNVEVIAAAAGDVEDQRPLFVPDVDSGWMSLHQRRDSFSQTKAFHEEMVDVVRLDKELSQRGVERVDYLKMDVEGHELHVLHGLGQYLSDGRVAALAFEFGAANVNSRTYFRDFWDLLTPLGYRLARIAPGGHLIPIPAYYETLEYFRGATNYLAVLNGRS